MKIIVAEHMGFCAGVAKAVETAYEMADLSNDQEKWVTFGPVIHNRHVTDDLAQKGVGIINSLDEWKGEKVIIRAHGVSPKVEEEMIRKGISYIDRTCSRVKAIHRWAEESKKAGRTLIVLGQAAHPEIIGVLGYGSEDSIVAEDAANLKDIDTTKLYTLVVQTTYKQEVFDKVVDELQNHEIDVIIHNTICNATMIRQQEADRISKKVDTMIILGDHNSANTRKLYEISKTNCPRSILTQSIHEIRLQDLFISDKIGLTAGASTPPSVTKEALFVMSELEKNMEVEIDTVTLDAVDADSLNPEMAASDIVDLDVADIDTQNSSGSSDTGQVESEEVQSAQSFEEMLNESFVTLHTGDVVKGTVIQVTGSEITVNLGYKSDGIIAKSEFTEDSNANLQDLVKPGDVIEVLVMRVNDGDGNVQASKRRLDAQTNYKLIEQAFNDKTTVKGKIKDLVKGGLIASIFGNRVFVPSSQISNRYVEDLSQFKGKEFDFQILEFDRSKRRIVAGRRELAAQEQRARREELYASLEVGQKIEGTVSRITDFGAFIDLGGVDGLVHISELAWRRVRKVSEVLNTGESVIVTVIEINPEKNKISLSLKDINNNPWNSVAEKYPIGSLVEGKVVRMAAFGAFVSLEDGIDGLVHVSQIAEKHVAKPEDELSVGQVITVKVTDVDVENKKISLSKKQADAPQYEDDDYDDDYEDDDYDDEYYDENDEPEAGEATEEIKELKEEVEAAAEGVEETVEESSEAVVGETEEVVEEVEATVEETEEAAEEVKAAIEETEKAEEPEAPEETAELLDIGEGIEDALEAEAAEAIEEVDAAEL